MSGQSPSFGDDEVRVLISLVVSLGMAILAVTAWWLWELIQ